MPEQVMEPHSSWPMGPAFKEILMEASRALGSLDASRLEELAVSCQALICKYERDGLAAQEADRGVLHELMFLGRMLDVTKANMSVLRQAETPRTEYNAASGRE